MRVVLLIVTGFISMMATGQLIPYNKNGSWGVVTTDRKTVIPLEFDHIEFCNLGNTKLIIAEKGELLFVFDTTGQLLKRIENPRDSMQRKRNLYRNCSHFSGNIFKGKFHLLTMTNQGNELSDAAGKTVIPFGTYDEVRPSADIIMIKKNGRYGILDSNLAPLLPLRYRKIEFSTQWVAAYTSEKKFELYTRKDWKRADCSVDPATFYYSYKHGLFMFESAGLKGVKDSVCSILIPPRYRNFYFEDSLIYALRPDKKYDVYNKRAALITTGIESYSHYNNHYWFFRKGQTHVYTQKLQPYKVLPYDRVSMVYQPLYTGAHWSRLHRDNVRKERYYASKGDSTAIIDINGNKLFPMIREKYEAVFDDYAVVTTKKIFDRDIDIKEKDTVHIIYSDGSKRDILLDGTAYGLPVRNRQAVLKNGKVGFVDFNGRQAIPPVFDRDQSIRTYSVNMLDRTTSFVKDKPVAEVKYKGRHVIIDTNGKILTDTTEPEGYAYTHLANDFTIMMYPGIKNTFALVDTFNSVVMKEEKIYQVTEKYFAAGKEGKHALFSNDMKQLTPFVYDWIYFDYYVGFLKVSRKGKEGYMTADFVEYFE